MLPTAALLTMPGKIGAIIPRPRKSTKMAAQPSSGDGGKRRMKTFSENVLARAGSRSRRLQSHYPAGLHRPRPRLQPNRRGSQKFRVKRIPDPVPALGSINYKKPKISKAQMQNPPPVFADMENFDFAVEADVVNFKFAFYRSGQYVEIESPSNLFTQEMKDIAKRFRVGDVFYLNEIAARMPDGETRTLQSLKLTVTE